MKTDTERIDVWEAVEPLQKRIAELEKENEILAKRLVYAESAVREAANKLADWAKAEG